MRHFISQLDLTSQEIESLLERSRELKERPYSDTLRSRTLVMFFEKSSTRTRLSFEIGMTQLGGHAVYLDKESSQLSRGESLHDTAKVVSRYADLMMARVLSHQTVTELARHAAIPVINGLSDEEHPCQSLSDLFTIREAKGNLAGLRLVWVGDGNNNVAHSLMLACALAGMSMVVAAPAALAPNPRYIDLAHEAGGDVRVLEDPREAVAGADIIYADVWVSMGQERERERRLKLLRPYQVSEQLARHAKSDFLFMHCLPAHIGEEVTAEVAYGPNSVIFDQAENRLHAQKALMLFLAEEAAEAKS